MLVRLHDTTKMAGFTTPTPITFIENPDIDTESSVSAIDYRYDSAKENDIAMSANPP